MAARAEATRVVHSPDSPLRRFLNITVALGVTEFKLRYFGSVLGYVWALFRPLLLFGVLYVVFTQIVRFGAGVEHYPVMLLTGLVLFSYFAEATGDAVSSIVTQEGLIQKMSFPIAAVPASVVLSSAINLVLNVVVVIGFTLASGVQVEATWLLLPVVLLTLIALSGGVGLLLSALYVRYRDIRPIWEVGLQMLFYGTPILYPIEAVSHTLQVILMCNPLAVIVEQVRHWVIDPTAPTAAEAIGGGVRLLIPLSIFLGVCALGVYLFRKRAPYFAEEL